MAMASGAALSGKGDILEKYKLAEACPGKSGDLLPGAQGTGYAGDRGLGCACLYPCRCFACREKRRRRFSVRTGLAGAIGDEIIIFKDVS